MPIQHILDQTLFEKKMTNLQKKDQKFDQFKNLSVQTSK
jgi:hypothetical protein